MASKHQDDCPLSWDSPTTGVCSCPILGTKLSMRDVMDGARAGMRAAVQEASFDGQLTTLELAAQIGVRDAQHAKDAGAVREMLKKATDYLSELDGSNSNSELAELCSRSPEYVRREDDARLHVLVLQEVLKKLMGEKR